MKNILRKFEKTLVELKEKKKNIDDFKTELEEYNNNFEKEIEEYNNKMNDLKKLINEKEDNKKDFNKKINEKKKEIANIIKRIENNKISNGKWINNYHFGIAEFLDSILSISWVLIWVVSYLAVIPIFLDKFYEWYWVILFLLPILLLGISILFKFIYYFFNNKKEPKIWITILLSIFIYWFSLYLIYIQTLNEIDKKNKKITNQELILETNKN